MSSTYEILEKAIGTNTGIAASASERVLTRPTRNIQWNWLVAMNNTGQRIRIFFNDSADVDRPGVIDLPNATGVEIAPDEGFTFNTVFIRNDGGAALTASGLILEGRIGRVVG